MLSLSPLPSMTEVRPPLYSTPVAAPDASPLGGGSSVDPLVSGPYTPSQIRHAYGFDQLDPRLDGSGQTIAIVDAYDNPTIASDLAVFDSTFGLPAANFTKVVPSSGVPSFDTGWAIEIALDVEWAHAVAPGARILLVEAASNTYNDLLSAVDTAVAMGASQVSMSWGGGDFSGESGLDYHFQHPGVTFLASSGDVGGRVEYPAASPYVTAVGGTTLTLDTNSNRVSETAWSGSGGGVSRFESAPAAQAGFFSGQGRGVPDVAYDADPSTGFYIYNTSNGGSWYSVGGTSAGAPQWAGLIALANQGRVAQGLSTLGTGVAAGTNPVFYQLAGGTSYTNPFGDYLDITSGSNGNPATTGYDLVTGLGSPIVPRLIPSLINPSNQPPTLAPVADQTVGAYPATLTLTLNGSDSNNDPLTYSARAQSLPYVLDQAYGLYSETSDYYLNARGQQEKYLRGTASANHYDNGGGNFWYYLLPSGDLYEFLPPYNNSALTGAFVASLGTAVYADPSLLWNAQNSPVPVALTVSGNQLTIAPSAGFAGAFLATATVDDGRGGTASRSFRVTVAAPAANQPPTLAPIADQTVAPYPASLTISLNGSDSNGDTLTYSAITQSQAYLLDQTYGLYAETSDYYFNSRGQQEKYLRGTASANGYNNGGGNFWYYLLPNGDLYEFTPPYNNPSLSGVFVASLGAAVYNDPSLLWDAQNTPVAVSLTVSGNQLTIAPNSGFSGIFFVIVTVDDGHGGSASRRFKVTV